MLARISRIVTPVLILCVALAAYRLLVTTNQTPATLTIPADRNEPWLIAPEHDEPRAVTDEQLKQVLQRVTPPREVNTNNWVHALRLWGPDAKFADATIPSGETMRNYFLDDAVFQQHAGQDTPPLFRITDRGVDVRGYDDDFTSTSTSSYHSDDLLATMAESGTPLNTVMHTRNGDPTVRDWLATSMNSFHLERHEYEWSMIAYARYLYPLQVWRNKYGETLTPNAMVAEMIEHPLFYGPCNGLHRLEAMNVLYRVDEQVGELSAATKNRMLGHMVQVSQLLVVAQSNEGFWTKRWPEGLPAASDSSASLYDKILVTGHHLEWLALAPQQVHPPRENIVRASQWLVNAMLEIGDDELTERFGPLSHAARALCLWRGAEPWPTWQRVHATPES